MASIQCYNKAEVYVGQERVGTALDIKIEVELPTRATFEATATPLPKPARVERWQRWRDSKGVEFTVTGPREDVIGVDIYTLRKDGEEGSWHGNNLLGGKNWTFLGYAKPDKVEVGQRWRSKTCGYEVRRKMAHPRRDDVWELLGEDRVAMDSTETEIRGWEYLGMAESEGAKKEAPRTYAGPQSVIAAKTEYVTVDDLSAPPIQTKRTADQARQDARRANAEAAKRLIANPPEWAYTKAWMRAVLTMIEMDGRVLDTMYPGMQVHEMLATYHHCRAIIGMTHEAATTQIVGDALKVVDAYARGMDRPSPLMGRPGVKGGISTCDLGADYE